MQALLQTNAPVRVAEPKPAGQSASFKPHRDREDDDEEVRKKSATWAAVVLLAAHGAPTRMAVCGEERGLTYSRPLDTVFFPSLQWHGSIPPYLANGSAAPHRAIKLTFLFWKGI